MSIFNDIEQTFNIFYEGENSIFVGCNIDSNVKALYITTMKCDSYKIIYTINI